MRAFLAALMLCAAVSSAAAQSAAVRLACTADALRLCDAAAIAHAVRGDHSGVIACFAAHRRELSAACAAAIGTYQTRKHGH